MCNVYNDFGTLFLKNKIRKKHKNFKIFFSMSRTLVPHKQTKMLKNKMNTTNKRNLIGPQLVRLSLYSITNYFYTIYLVIDLMRGNRTGPL